MFDFEECFFNFTPGFFATEWGPRKCDFFYHKARQPMFGRLFSFISQVKSIKKNIKQLYKQFVC